MNRPSSSHGHSYGRSSASQQMRLVDASAGHPLGAERLRLLSSDYRRSVHVGTRARPCSHPYLLAASRGCRDARNAQIANWQLIQSLPWLVRGYKRFVSLMSPKRLPGDSQMSPSPASHCA